MHLEVGSIGLNYTRWSLFTISSVLQYFDQISYVEGASTQTLASDCSPFNSAPIDEFSSVLKHARIEDTQGRTVTTDTIFTISLIEFQTILRHRIDLQDPFRPRSIGFDVLYKTVYVTFLPDPSMERKKSEYCIFDFTNSRCYQAIVRSKQERIYCEHWSDICDRERERRENEQLMEIVRIHSVRCRKPLKWGRRIRSDYVTL